MSSTNTALHRNLPSVKALLFFDVVARHQNLVRAGEELHLTQGALSRQLKALEDHLGVILFFRGPRGLKFTQEGELLYDYTRRAFETLGSGLRRLSVDAARETLVVSVARSFAACVLAPKIDGFAQAHPWVDLRIDVHRYFTDLELSGADISIRLGAGDWEGYRMLALTGDTVCAVCSPAMAVALQEVAPPDLPAGAVLLRNAERDYWAEWIGSGNRPIDLEAVATVRCNDSVALIEAVKAGGGLCLTRHSLAAASIAARSLVPLWGEQLNDGLRYYALSARRSHARRAVELFMQWLESEFTPARSS